MVHVKLTDQKIAKLIKKHSLILRSSTGNTLATNYYSNADLSYEMLIIMDNVSCEKVIYIVQGLPNLK